MPRFVLRLYALRRWLSSRTKNMTTKRVRVGIFGVGFFLSVYASPAYAQNGPNDSLLQTFGDIAFTVASAITQLIVLMIDLMVPIMTYNDFVNNPVVKAGWAIVRDTVNMFFVVILIIIAFGTIFGAERFKWQQQVPRLLIMAIVINFSKTLCGIMIDFGQVIMLTFANALREIAAGNFIQLLGLSQIYSISQNSQAITNIKKGDTSSSWQAFDFLASGLASMVLTMSVLAILIIMVAVLLFRIIMLWVLVVIAPLAWFVRGAEDIIKSDAYKEWWAEFKCLVGIGPVLAFFLWLTLAVAGAGNIAANSGFNVSSSSNSADFTSSIFELNNFLSFLIGMALLTAGLQAAVQFCSSAKFSGGKIGSLIKTGQGLPQAFVRTTAGLAAKGGSLGLRGGSAVAAATPGLLRGIGKRLPVTGLSTVARDVSAGVRGAMWKKAAGVGGDTLVGKWARGKAIDVQSQHRAEQFKDVDTEKEAMKSKDSTWKKNRIFQNLRNPPSSDKGRSQEMALFEEMMGDKQLQKDLGRDKVEALWKRHGSKYKTMANGNSAKTTGIEAFEKVNADFVVKDEKDPAKKKEWMDRHLKDADDAKELSGAAWANADVQARTANIQTTHGGESMTALEAAKRGHYGVRAKEAAVRGTDVVKLQGTQQREDHFTASLETGNEKGAKEVIAKMEADYTNTSTTDEDRQRMARSMDRMRAAAEKMGKQGNKTAATLAGTADDTRKRMEGTAGFGVPPVAQQGQSAESFVQENYAQASDERLEHGIQHTTTQETSAQSAVSALDAEIKNLETSDKATNETVAAKRKQIEEIRSRIERSTQPEIDAAYNELRTAKKLLEEAKSIGDTDQVSYMEEEVRQAQSTHTNAQKSASSELDDDEELTELKQEIENLMTAAGSGSGEDMAKKSAELAELKEQAKKLAEVRKKLEEERDRR